MARTAGPGDPDLPGDPEQALGDPESVARIVCLRLLERRAHTRAELADALRRRGIPNDAATVVLDRFTGAGLIDDAAVAEAVATAQHAERGLARRAIAVKLRQRGVAEDVIGVALTGIEAENERERARDLVRLMRRRRMSLAGVPVQTQIRRLAGLLARKGYSPAVAYQVIREELCGSELGGPDAGAVLDAGAEFGPGQAD